ncbi:RAMP superfamily CRISPR-associated protein [Calorimonas adulescens]|nr:RAMP superfamily CRISPR-associated protein [Calorimonas adulescens]
MSDLKVYSMASDPIYIGTGGYTIGRVDNTIVRDPITRIPKIPGSSFAGTMRFYSALKLQSAFKEEYRMNPSKRKVIDNLEKLFNNNLEEWMKYEGNKWSMMKCAGQDDKPNEYYENDEEIEKMDSKKSGHCGHCIVCKTFGYSKDSKSQQGIAFFSDLNIIFFPVYTREGIMWITSKQLLEFAEISIEGVEFPQGEKVIVVQRSEKNKEGNINLGWLNLPYEIKHYPIADELPDDIKKYIQNKIVLVPDDLISHIINSNLEVRTSVSIDPLTGASKVGALFTSEAIPRGTVFYGDIRLIERPVSNDMPSLSQVEAMLKDASRYYESFGIGGMVTRGFGRMKVFIR